MSPPTRSRVGGHRGQVWFNIVLKMAAHQQAFVRRPRRSLDASAHVERLGVLGHLGKYKRDSRNHSRLSLEPTLVCKPSPSAVRTWSKGSLVNPPSVAEAASLGLVHVLP